MNKEFPIFTLCLLAISGSSDEAAADEQLYSQYEPTPVFPVGRANPEAPAEIGQFDFLVGSFSCESELFVPSRSEFVALATRWTAQYVLNGWAIQDKTWNSALSATSIRIFNAKSGQWEVTFFMQPYGQTGVWRGGRVRDEMVLTKAMEDGDGAFTSRLTFSDISDSGFNWISEYVRDGKVFHTTWKIDCKRD
ncbi:MAG: hypothetical protein WB812_11850 [Woeseiaceae bacterium]